MTSAPFTPDYREGFRINSKGFTTFSLHKRGFTLIELMVVVSIIAILSLVGMTVYTGVQKSARDTKRKADIDAISKAYEAHYSNTGYQALDTDDFASGEVPDPPEGGDYFNWLAQDGSGFKVCAALDDNENTACNTPAQNCYCKASSQGAVSSTSSSFYDLSSTLTGLGFGGSSQSSCDTNTGLVGHWKMDGNANDSAGSNHGTATNVSFTPGLPNLGDAANFNGTSSYIVIPDSSSLRIASYTVSAWIKPVVDDEFWTGVVGKPGRNFNIWLGAANTSSGYIHHQFHVTGNTDAGCPNLNGVTIDGNTWAHIVITNDGTTCRTYLNQASGNTSISGSIASSLIVDNNPVYVGRNLDGGFSNYYRGLIDDVRIYNRVLSPEDVSTLFNGNNCVP